MHNRRKLDRPLRVNELHAMKEKSVSYKSLVELILEKRQKKDYSTDSLELLGKMLKLNPDFYSLWNFRREILLHLLPELKEYD